MPEPENELLRTAPYEPAAGTDPNRTTDHSSVSPESTEDGTRTPPADDDSSLPTVPGYEILGEIARGGMGRILAGRELSLGREVAIKVLLAGKASPAAAARFVSESEVTARLTHPGVPPVYELGKLSDGSPFLALKLIRGRSLAAILKERRSPAEELPQTMHIFEQVCNTVGFAHGAGIIHRDLKPLNVMVGAFGEVQVMDWGLAKEVRNAERGTRNENPEAAAEHSALSTQHSDATAAGAVLGTLAYMPPEQARGELDKLGPPSDVFALGAMLCEILTGKPPYTGATSQEVWAKASRGDVADAFARLDGCGADAELIALAKQCLAANPEDRPGNGSAVAGLIAAHRLGVEARLRAAEREAARAGELRKRRRAQLLLVAALAVLLVGAGAFAWWRDRQQFEKQRSDLKHQAEQAAKDAELREKAQRARESIKELLGLSAELRKRYDFHEARNALQEADRLTDSAAGELKPVVAQALSDLEFVRELDGVRRRRSVFLPMEGNSGTFRLDDSRAPEEYRTAFQKRGFDFSVDTSSLVARLNASPIKAELVAALDDWCIYDPNAAWSRKLLEVTREADPGPWLNRFRDPAVRRSRVQLQRLAEDAIGTTISPHTLAVLCELMRRAYIDPSDLLIAAQLRDPKNLTLTMALATHYLTESSAKALPYFVAALSLRPDDAMILTNLAVMQNADNNTKQARQYAEEAIRRDREFAGAHHARGWALFKQNQLDEAEAAYRESLRLDPKIAPTHCNLALILWKRNDFKGAIVCLREAIRLDTKLPIPHHNLGRCLAEIGELDEAITEYRTAIKLDAKYIAAHANLGNALRDKKDFRGAVASYREAVELDPRDAELRYMLGLGLRDSKNLPGALAEFREAVRLDPERGQFQDELGNALRLSGDVPGAITALREAVRLQPKIAPFHHNLAVALLVNGDRTAAIASFREAIRLNPKLFHPHQGLAQCLVDEGDDAGAVVEYRAALEIDPKREACWNDMGSALYRLGDYAGAETALRKAIELQPNYPRAHVNLGYTLGRLGDSSGSKAAFAEAARLDPKRFGEYAKKPPVVRAVAPMPRLKGR